MRIQTWVGLLLVVLIPHGQGIGFMGEDETPVSVEPASGPPRQCWVDVPALSVPRVWLLATAANAQQLQHTGKDARRFVQAVKQRLSGHDVRTCVLEQATRVEIERAFQRLSRVSPNDLVVFYFSGHGSQITDDDGDELHSNEGGKMEEFFVTADFDYDAYIRNPKAYPVMRDDDFARWSNAVSTPEFIAVLDACFSANMVRGEAESASEGANLISKFYVLDWLKALVEPPLVHVGTIDGLKQGLVLSASSAGQKAWAYPQHGSVFTTALLKAMENEPSKSLGFALWYEQVQHEVQLVTRNRQKQQPAYGGDGRIWERWFKRDSHDKKI